MIEKYPNSHVAISMKLGEVVASGRTQDDFENALREIDSKDLDLHLLHTSTLEE